MPPRFVTLPSIYPPASHMVNRDAVVAIDPHAYAVPTQGQPMAGSSVHLISGMVMHVALDPAAVVKALEDAPPV